MKLPAVFERYREEIDVELKLVLSQRQSPLYDMMRYHLGWTDEKGNPHDGTAGKALRPTLCLLACEAVGGNYCQALPAAAAVELVHNYSLIHDDIQDDDCERRHRPTVWSIWGKPQAINAGTAMRVLANVALLRLEGCGVPREKQIRTQSLMDEASLKLLEGQYLDISYETHFGVRVADYVDMIEKKTAALIAASLEIGALLGTDKAQVIARFRDIGRNLGLAFQIRDDVLGIWGDEGETGKPLGGDIRRRKKTFPIVYVLEKADPELRTELIEVYRREMVDGDGVAIVLTILESVEAQRQAQTTAENYCHHALETVAGLALPSAAKRDLTEMAHFLIERNF